MSYAIAGFGALLVFALGQRLFNRLRGGLIPACEARALVDSGAQLVDVRTTSEFASGHLDGARNVPLDTVERSLEALGKRQEPIVLYCRSGVRSGRAKSILERHGYTQVHNVGPMTRYLDAKA